MYELIYAGREVENLIRRKYPNTVIKDASDYIHTERFECELPGVDKEDFYPWAIREGFAETCIGFSLLLNSLKFTETKEYPHKETKEKLERWTTKAKEMTDEYISENEHTNH